MFWIPVFGVELIYKLDRNNVSNLRSFVVVTGIRILSGYGPLLLHSLRKKSCKVIFIVKFI